MKKSPKLDRISQEVLKILSNEGLEVTHYGLSLVIEKHQFDELIDMYPEYVISDEKTSRILIIDNSEPIHYSLQIMASRKL